MRRLLFAGALLVLSGAARPAGAASGVLVLPLEHDGLPRDTASALDAAVRTQVKASLPKLELLPPPALGLIDLQLAAGCVDASPKCLAKIGRTLRAARVLRVIGRGSAKRLSVRILSVSTRSARAKDYEADLVDVDADSALELRWHVAKALGDKPPPLTGRIELHTASKVGALAGAEVFLDDARVPAGRLSTVQPGRHRLEVRQQGFETFIWLGQVRGGRATRVAVQFVPKQSSAAEVGVVQTPDIGAAPAPPPVAAPSVVAPRPDEPTLVYTWIFGAGAVLATTTATILAVQTEATVKDVEAQQLACEGDNPVDADHDLCRKGQRLEKFQFAFWAGGVALAGAAIAAFFLEGGPDIVSNDAEDAVLSVGVAPGPDGFAASLRVAF